MRLHRHSFTFAAFARPAALWLVALSLAVAGACLNPSTASACSAPNAEKASGAQVAPVCSQRRDDDAASARSAARRIVSASRGVSKRAAIAAVAAAERVEREMHKEGAYESVVLGCWRGRPAVDCTAEVKGNDGYVIWRCVLQIRVQKNGSRHKSKLTDAVCAAEEAAPRKKHGT